MLPKKSFHLKNKIRKLFTHISLWLWNQLKKIDTASLSQKLSTFFSRYSSWIIVALVSLALADITLLFIWPSLLPSKGIKNSALPVQVTRSQTLSPVDFLHTANIFHPGPIPLSLKEDQEDSFSLETPQSESSLSNLPFQLLGTIESMNPQRSMASIRISSTEPTLSYFVGDEIDGKARITIIERRHVKFINLLNNRLEHIEIPLDYKLQMTTVEPDNDIREEEEEKTKPTIEGVSQIDTNKYEVTRSVINNHIRNLPDILQQARVEPKIDPDGRLVGHEFQWIKKGSIYENLGFKKGDTLISINNKKVNNEMEAQRLFQQFRTSSQFSIKIQNKNGQERELSYNIDEDTSIE